MAFIGVTTGLATQIGFGIGLQGLCFFLEGKKESAGLALVSLQTVYTKFRIPSMLGHSLVSLSEVKSIEKSSRFCLN